MSEYIERYWRDAKWLLENAVFIDTGKPVGKEVVQ